MTQAQMAKVNAPQQTWFNVIQLVEYVWYTVRIGDPLMIISSPCVVLCHKWLICFLAAPTLANPLTSIDLIHWT